MFENILHQKDSVEALTGGIRRGDLPRALLFSGPAYAGKLTAALELARSLSCRLAKADWNCACPACESHRRLQAPDLAILGKRSFSEEIAAGVSLVKLGDSRDRERIFFVRSVRKLTRRFDSSLWQGEENRLSKAAPTILSIDELMGEFEGCQDSAQGHKLADKIAAECCKLEDSVPDTVPVFQVRSIAFWCRLKPQERTKTIVVENADTMQESSRNAFLKVLEEPPDNVQFVLTTGRRGSVMKTILSRVRTVPFAERLPGELDEVIERIFRGSPRGDGLRGYFSSFKAIPGETSRELANAFLAGIVSEASMRRKVHPAFASVFPETGKKTIAEILKATKAFGAKEGPEYRGAFGSFLESMTQEMSVLLRDGNSDSRVVGTAERWNSLLREARQRHSSFNVQPQAVLEYLRSAMRDAL